MTEIVQAIYDMMGKYTYPALKGDVAKQHVDAFFQVCMIQYKHETFATCVDELWIITYYSALIQQKMDKNKDGVVTLDEFVLACQEVQTRLH